MAVIFNISVLKLTGIVDYSSLSSLTVQVYNSIDICRNIGSSGTLVNTIYKEVDRSIILSNTTHFISFLIKITQVNTIMAGEENYTACS